MPHRKRTFFPSSVPFLYLICFRIPAVPFLFSCLFHTSAPFLYIHKPFHLFPVLRYTAPDIRPIKTVQKEVPFFFPFPMPTCRPQPLPPEESLSEKSHMPAVFPGSIRSPSAQFHLRFLSDPTSTMMQATDRFPEEDHSSKVSDLFLHI